MAKRYQILERHKAGRGEERNAWRLVAHGARYDSREEAEAMAALIRRNGRESKLLPV